MTAQISAAETSLDQVKQLMLVPTGVGFEDLERAMGRLMSRKLDYADLYCQATRYETWTVEDGIVREGIFSLDQGVGVRAISGEKTGFAYADQLDLESLTDAVTAARSIAHSAGATRYRLGRGSPTPPLYPAVDPLPTRSDEDKVALLARLDREARALDRRVVEVIASLQALHDVVLIVASDGTLAADIRPLVRLNVSVILEDGGRREQGYAGAGGRGNLELVMDSEASLGIAAEAVRQAQVNLEAIPAPAGNMTVVLGCGWPGVLLHEAIGHGLEGDFNRKKTSAFSGRLGERVASEQCTVVDDGTLPGRRGSLTVDDEGTPSQCTTLIENGILRAYMQDKHNARLMGTSSTGNARRESYAHAPMPRMTNTYMLPGQYDPNEILASVERGIYAPNFGGGQVDITSGKFVFSISEGYLIEKGKKTSPVKGAMLIGSGPEVLTRVSMVGNDLELDTGIGICGKDGQSVPVGVGQPTLRVDGLTVGGTQA
ncbi:MAG TPA: metalloprotease TldD [Gammaproteobacteria bacterium]|nr:metalloprotease TldD [Gammaproteobacteria bacterium]